jgi:protein TorT
MRLSVLAAAVVAGTVAATAPAVKAERDAPTTSGPSEPPAAVVAPDATAETWYPQSIERRRPPFYEGGAFTRLDYVPLAGAAERWRLCAVLPPKEFEYFQALAGGLAAEAARQGVDLRVHHVESFDEAAQAALLERCLDDGTDALLVAAVARAALDAPLSHARARGVPIIDLATGSGGGNVTARLVTDRAAVGREAGRFLADRYPAGGAEANAVWFYGPPGSAIARQIDQGFRAGIARGEVHIVHAEEIALSDREIRRTIREIVDTVGTFDILVGGSRTIQLAAEELAAAFGADAVELIAVTASASMLAAIEADRVVAAVNDKVVAQGRIGVDLAVRAIEGRPHLRDLRPDLEIITRGNVETFDRRTILSPE